MHRTIKLPEEQVGELEQLAAREHRSLDELVQAAVGDYLARRRNWADWGRRWDALVADVQSRMPPDVTPEEIEADITANFQEYLAERAAERRADSNSADASRR
jgi:predicted transcriptional regulator